MAIDTRNKRAASLLEGIFPTPDAAPMNIGDKMQALWLYRFEDAPPPSSFGGSSDRINVGITNFGTTIQVGFGM